MITLLGAQDKQTFKGRINFIFTLLLLSFYESRGPQGTLLLFLQDEFQATLR